ncbi:MAG: pyridoxal-phosphate dependent enzyme, partial [Myxococcaceae bacterium]
MLSFQSCISCHQRYDLDKIIYRCDCSGLIEIKHSKFPSLQGGEGLGVKSGVWRFKDYVLPVPDSDIVSHPEGFTRIYEHPKLSSWAGVHKLFFKHEGENPTGSFKDRGMTVAVTQAKRLGQRAVACASTGNT